MKTEGRYSKLSQRCAESHLFTVRELVNKFCEQRFLLEEDEEKNRNKIHNRTSVSTFVDLCKSSKASVKLKICVQGFS